MARTKWSTDPADQSSMNPKPINPKPINPKPIDDATEAVLRASRALVGVAAQSLARTEAHLTLVQYRALVALGVNGDQNVGTLADTLGIHPSTATRLCDRLVAKGLMERKTSEASRREVTVALSRAGAALVTAETDRRRQAIRRIVERLDRTTQLEIVAAIGALVDAAEEAHDDAWKLGWTA
jgi:DNA-binding MarR family transcriptional regulator